MTLRICCFCFFLALFGRFTAAQEHTPTPVYVDALALDGRGNPVPGLGRGAFAVLDDKQPQAIRTFAPAGSPADSPTEMVLLIDAVNTGFSTVSYARDQVDRFLRANGGKLAVPVTLAILTDRGPAIESSPTRDGIALAAALDGRQTGLRTITRSSGFYGAGERLDISLHAITNLSDYERNRPGHKLVIWVSPGWPYLTGPRVSVSDRQQRSLFNTVVNLATALREARITLYSVDPLGSADAGGIREFYYKEFLKPLRKPSDVQPANLALQVLAEQSGGRVLNSSNDIAGEIRSCVGEIPGFYSLSFLPANSETPDQFHSLIVKADSPGLKVPTRAGYYASPGAPARP